MIPDKFIRIDLQGIDIVESQGEEIPGLYNELVESIQLCRYQIIYNWKFNGILIPPTYVELQLAEEGMKINRYITVTSDDIIHIYSLEIEPNLVELSVSENGVFEPLGEADGFSVVTVNVPPTIPVLENLSVTANGIYTPEEGVDGFSAVSVDVPSVSIPWREPLSVNWDFANAVNTRGNSHYGSSGLIYTLDGWQLQGGTLDIVSGGIKLERYSSGTPGYFMQRFNARATAAMVGREMTFTCIVDGVLASKTANFPSAGTGTAGTSANGIIFRIWNYGSEAAIDIDIATDSGSHVVQAVKLEVGDTQTLAHEVNGVWVLNNSMDTDTEYIMVQSGLVLNS